MDDPRNHFLGQFLDWLDPPQLWEFLCLPRTRYVLSWLVAAAVALGALLYGLVAFDEPKRGDGNSGHVQIDFGGQWLIARMLAEGHGRELYNRDRLRQVLTAAYPVEDQTPDARLSDAEQLMRWLMGSDGEQGHRPYGSAEMRLYQLLDIEPPDPSRPIGGPLYPPIHALLHYPLGTVSPHVGYRTMQAIAVILAFVAAGGVRLISRGQIWWPVAATVIMGYPGFSAAVNLGQNPVLTLAILTWGWVFLAREHDVAGGIVWGFLAYKPVWATAFFLMLVLSGRWRSAAAMLLAAAALAALTLPLVGVHGWFDWLEVGREATLLYNVDENWIKSSRDLLSMPRRTWIDFKLPYAERDLNWMPPAVIGWSMIAFVAEITVRVACLRRSQARTPAGEPAAFLLLGAWLTCFHFMYYDVLLTVLPVFLLFINWRRYLVPQLVALPPVPRALEDAAILRYFEPRRASTVPAPLALLEAGPRRVWVLNGVVPTLTAFILLSLFVPTLYSLAADSVPPFDTYCLIALWLWCGWVWLKGTDRPLAA